MNKDTFDKSLEYFYEIVKMHSKKPQGEKTVLGIGLSLLIGNEKLRLNYKEKELIDIYIYMLFWFRIRLISYYKANRRVIDDFFNDAELLSMKVLSYFYSIEFEIIKSIFYNRFDVFETCMPPNDDSLNKLLVMVEQFIFNNRIKNKLSIKEANSPYVIVGFIESFAMKQDIISLTDNMFELFDSIIDDVEKAIDEEKDDEDKTELYSIHTKLSSSKNLCEYIEDNGRVADDYRYMNSKEEYQIMKSSLLKFFDEVFGEDNYEYEKAINSLETILWRIKQANINYLYELKNNEGLKSGVFYNKCARLLDDLCGLRYHTIKFDQDGEKIILHYDYDLSAFKDTRYISILFIKKSIEYGNFDDLKRICFLLNDEQEYRDLLFNKCLEQDDLLAFSKLSKKYSEEEIKKAPIVLFLQFEQHLYNSTNHDVYNLICLIKEKCNKKQIKKGIEYLQHYEKEILKKYNLVFLLENDDISEKMLINSETSNRKGCYIATCVYGSYDCPEVWVLRRFRDYKLNRTFFGKIFISIYYFVSPTIVKLFGDTKLFKSIFKKKLDRLIIRYKKKGFDDTPYNDLY